MRYIDLFEYKRDVTLQRFGDKLMVVFRKQFPNLQMTDVEEIIIDLENMDPTKNKQYTVWIIQQFLKKLFRIEDAGRVRDILTQFHTLKPRLDVDKRDINRMDFHELQELITKLNNPEFFKQQKELNIDGLNPKSYELLYNGPHGTLVSPATKQAACVLGAGTKWCTSAKKNNMFDYYGDGKLFIWKDTTGKYQFHFETMQFMDAMDAPIDLFHIKRWRNEHPVLSKLFKDNEENIGLGDPGDIDWDDVIQYSIIVTRTRREPMVEDIFVDFGSQYNYDNVIEYAESVMKDRWPKLESTLLRNYKNGTDDIASCLDYAESIVGGRWTQLEKIMLQKAEPLEPSQPDAKDFYNYVDRIYQDRWPEAEQAMLRMANPNAWQDVQTILDYRNSYIEGNWPAGDKWLDHDVAQHWVEKMKSPEWDPYHKRP